MVDTRARVVCRRGRRRCLQARVFGRDDPQLTARIIDGDGAHRGQEIGTEVGQRTLAGPDQVIDPQARLSDDVLSGGASTVAVGHGIRGGQVPTPQLGVSLGVSAPDHPQEGDIVSVRPLLPPEQRWCRHNEPPSLPIGDTCTSDRRTTIVPMTPFMRKVWSFSKSRLLTRSIHWNRG